MMEVLALIVLLSLFVDCWSELLDVFVENQEVSNLGRAKGCWKAAAQAGIQAHIMPKFISKILKAVSLSEVGKRGTPTQ